MQTNIVISGSQQNLRTRRHGQCRNMINTMRIGKSKGLEVKSFTIKLWIEQLPVRTGELDCLPYSLIGNWWYTRL